MVYTEQPFYRSRWTMGIVFSVLLHGSFAVWYFYSAPRQRDMPPNAVPIDLSMISPMPMSPQIEEVFDVPHDEAQVESAQATPAPEPERVEIEPLAPVAYETADEQADFAVEVEAVPEQPVFEIPEEPIVELAEVEPEIVETDDMPVEESLETPIATTAVSEVLASDDSSAPETTMPKAVDADLLADQLAAQRAGMLQQQAREAANVQWQHILQAHLERHKQYPRSAQRRRLQGSPIVAFTMTRDGRVLSVQLVSSSGAEVLDREAQEMIRRAEPLPAVPAEIEGMEITLTLPINFYL